MKDQQNNYSPEIDKAKAQGIEWLYNPKDRKAIRTFTHINPGGPYVFSAYVEEMNYMKQLCEAPMLVQCQTHQTFHKVTEQEDETSKECKLTGLIDFEINHELEDEVAKNFADNILLLSPAANGKRALTVADMIKNMNRPSFNPMGMLGGMLNGKPEDAPEETQYPDDLD